MDVDAAARAMQEFADTISNGQFAEGLRFSDPLPPMNLMRTYESVIGELSLHLGADMDEERILGLAEMVVRRLVRDGKADAAERCEHPNPSIYSMDCLPPILNYSCPDCGARWSQQDGRD